MVGGASSRVAPTVEGAGRARAERTINMDRMSVTLDVSRLSGWLNARAFCRVKRESIEEGDMRASRLEGGVGWSVAQAAGRPGLWRLRAGHARSAPQTFPSCL